MNLFLLNCVFYIILKFFIIGVQNGLENAYDSLNWEFLHKTFMDIGFSHDCQNYFLKRKNVRICNFISLILFKSEMKSQMV